MASLGFQVFFFIVAPNATHLDVFCEINKMAATVFHTLVSWYIQSIVKVG